MSETPSVKTYSSSSSGTSEQPLGRGMIRFQATNAGDRVRLTQNVIAGRERRRDGDRSSRGKESLRSSDSRATNDRRHRQVVASTKNVQSTIPISR